MSKEGDKASVFRTTRVRTKLKGDASWLQPRSEAQAETEEEKPWLAEVRAGRLNGAPVETSPVSSPTKPTVPPTKSDTERTPTQGYLIRGVFTKLDNKPASPTSSNGLSGTTQLKKPSENYKKIAPHTRRSTSDSLERHLSLDEQEKRKEAASNVLKRSSAKERSYVFSAAKKYESKDADPEASLVNRSSFVAKRVEITDDEESVTTPAPASTPSPAVPVASVPEPKPRVNTSVKTATDEPVASKPVKEDLPPQDTKPLIKLIPASPTPKSPTLTDPKAPAPVSPAPTSTVPKATAPVSPAPTSTKPQTTAPILTDLKTVAAVSPALTQTDTKAIVSVSPTLTSTDSKTAAQVSSSDPKPAPLVSSPPISTDPKTAPLVSPVPTSTQPKTAAPVSAATVITLKTEPKPEPKKPSSDDATLTALSDTLIFFHTSSTSIKDDKPVLTKDEAGSTDSPTKQDSVGKKPVPALGSYELLTDDLLALSDGSKKSPEPVPPSPRHSSQDLLGELDSLSTQAKEWKQTDETAKETQSHTEAVTKTTKTVIITEKREETSADPWSTQVRTTVTKSSSADPFDPYPIGTTSPNSSSDLLQPLTDTSINSRITQRSWTHSWETSALQETNTEESQEAEPEDQAEDQQTLIKFERTSTENDSPWARWTSPTVYTLTTTRDEEEEEEEEERPKDTQTVTTTTIIRETHSDPKPVVDRYETYSRTVTEEDRRVQAPEPDTRKGFVFVKEYVSATELALHNARDTVDSGSDYLTSSSTSYSYSSPSTYSSGSLSSTCTYCGEQVGNDAKITIEHLNINCHPECFKCDVCGTPMGDLLHNMFLHHGKVHCESCYSNMD